MSAWWSAWSASMSHWGFGLNPSCRSLGDVAPQRATVSNAALQTHNASIVQLQLGLGLRRLCISRRGRLRWRKWNYVKLPFNLALNQCTSWGWNLAKPLRADPVLQGSTANSPTLLRVHVQFIPNGVFSFKKIARSARVSCLGWHDIMRPYCQHNSILDSELHLLISVVNLLYICYISVVWCCMNLNICLTCSNSANSNVTRWGWCVSSETWLRAISPWAPWALTPTNRMRLNSTILSRARANLTPQINELGWKTNILCVERWLVTARSHAALRCSVKICQVHHWEA